MRIAIKSSSFAMLMKTSMNPEMNPFFASGMTIFVMRRQKLAPAISAASSSSPLICIMFAEPERLANGKCLTTDVSKISANVPYKEGMIPPSRG